MEDFFTFYLPIAARALYLAIGVILLVADWGKAKEHWSSSPDRGAWWYIALCVALAVVAWPLTLSSRERFR